MVRPGSQHDTRSEDDRAHHETAATIAAFAKGGRFCSSPPSTELHASTLRMPVATTQEMMAETMFSSIGFGIDTTSRLVDNDATTAAVKAVNDALERVLRFPSTNNLAVHVKLGVPVAVNPNSTIQVPMLVDTRRIAELLPPNIPHLPMEVLIGGLATQTGEATSVITAIACIAIQVRTGSPFHMRQQRQMSPGVASPTSVTSPQTAASSTEGVVVPPATWAEVENEEEEATGAVVAPPPLVTLGARPGPVHRSMSMEVLARISAEIHEQQPDEKATSSTYRKLPPGTTPKNNKRLFVKHQYRDFSQELPRADELDLLPGPNSNKLTRTPNAAFPLKLHETLEIIEADGLAGIIGWLPTGRSFRIFNQKDFVEIVLPKYFVMTKKSSFLRQLNLYGFNRLSRVGPDQGSYYHEKFLRGLKFLTRRMQRQKVNGNGIRAAGNPDEEPNLSLFPACPPGTNVVKPVVPPTVQLLPPSVPQTSVQRQTRQSSSADTVTSQNTRDDAVLRASSGQQVSFPLKLQRILDKFEAMGEPQPISWQKHGRAFIVHDSTRFVEEVMPVYFNQSKFSSFQRQLHMYNFQRITSPGADKGAYHHPCFLRGQPELALKMHRIRVNGRGTRRPGNPEAEPNFSRFDPMPPIPRGTSIEVPLEQHHKSDDYSESGEQQEV